MVTHFTIPVVLPSTTMVWGGAYGVIVCQADVTHGYLKDV